MLSFRSDCIDLAGELYRRALVLERRGDRDLLGEAAEAAAAARLLYSRHVLPEQEARASASNARLLASLGRPREAGRAWRRAAECYHETGRLVREAVCLVAAGGAEARSGEIRQALRSIEKARALGASPRCTCRCLLHLGRLRLLLGDESAAKELLERAGVQAARSGFENEAVEALMRSADLHEARGEIGEALRRQTEASNRAGMRRLRVGTGRRLGRLLLREDRVDEAVERLIAARDLAGAGDAGGQLGRVLRRLAVATARLGRRDRAMRLAALSLELFRSRGAVFDVALLRLERARIALMQEDAATDVVDRAWSDALAAQYRFGEAGAGGLLLESRQVLSRITRRRLAVARRLRIGSARSVEKDEPAIIAVDASMRAIVDRCEMFGRCDDPVLITGETGCGKEVLARHVHRSSGRAGGPLVAVNVAAIPEAIFEREFFGHMRGAFSGADTDGAGYVAAAARGTLFLDEIADLPLDLQPKLLRLLQEGRYTPLGDPKERRADVRLVAATNGDLPALVAAGAFRLDLYYRLRVLEIEIPPLRLRPDDIPALLDHFLGRSEEGPLRAIDCFDAVSLDRLRRYAWPGNVRELEMVARRAILSLRATGEVAFEIGDGSSRLRLSGAGSGPATAPRCGADRGRMLLLLDEVDGNRSEAARRLGIARQTLYRRLNKLGIT